MEHIQIEAEKMKKALEERANKLESALKLSDRVEKIEKDIKKIKHTLGIM